MKQKIQAINSLLLSDWDPIWIWEDWPKDEYESYALQIAGCLEKDGTKEDIKNLLNSYEREYMGLIEDDKRAWIVAEKIYKIWYNTSSYLKVFTPVEKINEQRKRRTFLEKLFYKILPLQNPDYDEKIDEVTIWMLEFESTHMPPIREIWLQNEGKIIMKMPNKNNYGYWIDNTLTYHNFIKIFKTQIITQEDFETSWNTL